MIKKLFLTLAIGAAGCFGQVTPPVANNINLLQYLLRCPPTANYFIMSLAPAGTITCVPIPPNISITGNPPILTITNPLAMPSMQLETISLASTAAGSTTITYTPTKTPITGLVFWWYESSSLALKESGAIPWITNTPLTITLPNNWSTLDAILIAYQYQ